MFWITTLSPTFLNELLDLPRKVSKRVSNKIKILETDPYSAEGDAKKLQDRDNIYRVRVGDYRIFYTIGENVVKVLTVRKRDDQTYRNPQDSTDPLPTAQIVDPEILAVTLPDDIPTTSPPEPEPDLTPSPSPAKRGEPLNASRTSLPRQFSQELFQQWLIPQEYWTQLQQIQTEEALLNSALPEKYLNRILDNLFPRTIEEIEAQASLVLPNSTDLDKFIEGDITDFLLKLDPDQEKLTEAIKTFLRRAAKQHRLPITSTAILCPTNQIGRAYAKQLSEEGLPAQFVSGQDINLKAPYIKVLTLHSAKGLEFPFVAIALARSTFPNMMPYTLPEEEQESYLNSQKRLFYVGCSRAMRSLLVTLPQGSSNFFDNLCPPTWETL